MHPFHSMQSIPARNKPINVGPLWAAALAWGLLLPSACRDTLLYGARGLQGDSLLHHGPCVGFRKLLLCTWSTSCPPLHWSGGCRAASVFLVYPSLTPLTQQQLRGGFHPSLNALSQWSHQSECLVWLWPVGPIWSWLELALANMRAAISSHSDQICSLLLPKPCHVNTYIPCWSLVAGSLFVCQ